MGFTIINPFNFVTGGGGGGGGTPTIASSSSGGAGISGAEVTSTSITAPSGVTIGDRLVVFVAGRGRNGSQVEVASGTGWTRVYSVNVGWTVSCAIFTKIADGTDALTVQNDGAQSGTFAYFATRITDAAGAVTVGTASEVPAGSASLNPGNINPGSSAERLWFGLGAWRGATGFPSGYPANLPDNHAYQLHNPSGWWDGVGITIATATTTASSLDPDAFSAPGSVVHVAVGISLEA